MSGPHDAVRDHTKDVGRALVDALDATFSSLGDRFRARLQRDETDKQA